MSINQCIIDHKLTSIYELEYKGIKMAIQLAKRFEFQTKRRISRFIDNWSVIEDLGTLSLRYMGQNEGPYDSNITFTSEK